MFDSNILIVDDEVANVMLLETMLNRGGYKRLRTAQGSLQGLAMAAEALPDLILLDLHMPELDGFGFLERLRTMHPSGEYLPVLVLTADVNRNTRRRALEGGASDFVTKPFEHDEVLLRCKNLLQTRALYQALANQNRVLEETVRERTLSLEEALADLKRREKQHVETERLRALGEMSSGVATDFNNQLTVLIGYSELLLLNHGQMLNNKAMATRYVETIHAAAQNSATVVGRLREFSRTREEGDVFLLVDLPALMDETARLTRPKWREQARAAGKHVQVRLELAAVPPIAGNAAELRDAVANLIFNAVDAVTEGGTVTLRAFRQDDTAVIEVTDTGIGMDEETRRRCLEPFFTTKGPGRGMGLSTVYGVVQRHDGQLSVSTAPGHGSTFSLRFPLPALAPEGTESALPPMGASRPLRVLLVEEDPQIRELVCEYLRRDQHEVSTAMSGDEGLRLFDEGEFDLVVTDLTMEGMDGEALASAIKAHSSTPVILLTAAADHVGDCGDRHSSVDAVLLKPLSSGELWRAMAQVTRDQMPKAIAQAAR